jgi:hypothetical protein
VIWVWSANAESRGASVQVAIGAAAYLGDPDFSVCPVSHGDLCKVGNLPTGQADELTLGIPVRSRAALGERVKLTAEAKATGSRSFTGSASDTVVANPNPSTSLPSAPVTLPPTTLPPIAGTGVSPSNPASLFPTVAPTQSPSSGQTSLGLPTVKPKRIELRAADAAATVPLDPRLIGGQLAGLAVLAGGVAIAIARLSLRTPKAQSDKGNQNSPE